MARKRKQNVKINSLHFKENQFIKPIFNSNNFGPFTVEEEVPKPEHLKGGRGNRYYRVKFINTGYETIAERASINYGGVRDNYYPTVAGVGYIGDFKGNIKGGGDYRVFDIYNAWSGMLQRCYNPDCHAYPTYGAIGVRVDERWHNFTNFLADAPLLPNYQKKAIYRDKYELDKDYLQYAIPKSQRIYSPQTCIWLSIYDNNMLMNRERETESGYFGVRHVYNSYRCIVFNKLYCTFTTAEAAAVCFNYLYPILKNDMCDLNIVNTNVPYMTLDQLREFAKDKDKFDLEVVQRLSERSTHNKQFITYF